MHRPSNEDRRRLRRRLPPRNRADYFALPGVVVVSVDLAVVSNGTTVPPRRPDNPRVGSESTSSVPDVPTETIRPPGSGRVLSPLEMSYVSLLDFGMHGGVDPFGGVDIFVHRNGEPDPCSRQRAWGGGGGKRDDDNDDDNDDNALSRVLVGSNPAMRE